jgi:hypothetical protein
MLPRTDFDEKTGTFFADPRIMGNPGRNASLNEVPALACGPAMSQPVA